MPDLLKEFLGTLGVACFAMHLASVAHTLRRETRVTTDPHGPPSPTEEAFPAPAQTQKGTSKDLSSPLRHKP